MLKCSSGMLQGRSGVTLLGDPRVPPAGDVLLLLPTTTFCGRVLLLSSSVIGLPVLCLGM